MTIRGIAWRRTARIALALAIAATAARSPGQGAAPEPRPPPRPEMPGGAAGDWVVSPLPGAPLRMAPALRAQLERDLLARIHSGRYESAVALLNDWRRAEPELPQHPYNLACTLSLAGRPAEAIEHLRTAIELGWVDFRYMERDPDLEAARALPAFEEIRALNEPTQRRLAERRLSELRAQLGDGFIYEADPELRLVFAAGVDRPGYETTRAHLAAFARALQKEIFHRGIEQFVAVILPKPDSRMRGPIAGYYIPEHRVFVVRTVGREMNHEFVHALHHADMDARGQKHPLWLMEGFAVLFESLHIQGDRIILEHSSRLYELQAFARRNRTLPFERLAALNSETLMQAARIAYPQAGYVLRYLYDLGLLNTWYEAYCEGFAQDATGLKALEKVLGKPLREIESDWKKWVMEQRPPPLMIGRRTPMLGILTEAHQAGLRVLDVVPGSPAAEAGMAMNDIVETVAGRRVTDPQQLIQLINERSVGERLEIEFRRGSERFIIRPALAERPTASR